MLTYFRDLTSGRIILWCYFIWYLVVLVRYFDPNPRIWMTSLGLSGIIGFALFVNTTVSGEKRVALDRWQVFRLFLTPFCVSSFSALVKGKGFLLVFSPDPVEIGVAAALCSAFILAAQVLRRQKQPTSEAPFGQ